VVLIVVGPQSEENCNNLKAVVMSLNVVLVSSYTAVKETKQRLTEVFRRSRPFVRFGEGVGGLRVGETYGSNKTAQLNGCSENKSRQVT